MDLAIGSVGGTGSGKAAAGATDAGEAEAGAGFDALPTIVETFFEMKALDFADREAPLPGSWTRYHSPWTACS
jgi:hypothetical protein